MGSPTYEPRERFPKAPSGARVLTALVVEDQTILREMLVELLEGDGRFASIVACGTAEEATAAISASSLDLALVDLMLPDGHGLDVLAALRKAHPRCRALV